MNVYLNDAYFKRSMIEYTLLLFSLIWGLSCKSLIKISGFPFNTAILLSVFTHFLLLFEYMKRGDSKMNN